MLFSKGRYFIFPAILLIGLSFIEEPGWAQLSPEPKEGFMAGQTNRISSPQTSGLHFHLSSNKDFTVDFAAGGQILPSAMGR